MNKLNIAIDCLTWAVEACHRMGSPALACLRDLKFCVALRDAIRYRGPGKRTCKEYGLIDSLDDEIESHMAFWMPHLKVAEE